MPTNNLNNKYTVSIVTDSTGGDNNPTASGYNYEYEMIITPKPGEDIVGGDFKIDNIGSVIADSSVGYPNSTPVSTPHGLGSSYSHLDLRTSTTTFASFTSYVFEANPSFQSKNIDYIILNEEYSVADFPIAFKLKIFMLSSFLNAGPTSVQIDLDIDLVSQVRPGCTNPNALNYNPVANLDDGSCIIPIVGCMDDGTNPAFPGRPSNAVSGPASNYDPNATQQGACNYVTFGCTDSAANNTTPGATIDDGSCTYDIKGCTDPVATNYNPNATVDDGSCILPVIGCMTNGSLNYNPLATIDDGSCIIPCDHVELGVSQEPDTLGQLTFYVLIDQTQNFQLFNYIGNPNFVTGFYNVINGYNPYAANYIFSPQFHAYQSQTPLASSYIVQPNYYNTLQIDYDNGSSAVTRIRDLDLTEEFFDLNPFSQVFPYYDDPQKPFTVSQLDYGQGLEPIRTGFYEFTFVIDDGFGNKCFTGANFEFQTQATANDPGGPPAPPPPPPTTEGEGGFIEGELPVGLPPAPEGFHYMPDGSLMSDEEHQDIFGSQTVIRTSINTGASGETPSTSSTSGY